MWHQMAGNAQVGMQQIMTVFAQTMAQLAQSNQQGFMQIAQSMGQIGNMIADAAERSDQNLGQLVQGRSKVTRRLWLRSLKETRRSR